MNALGSDLVRLAVETSLRISKLPTARQQTEALRQHIEASDVFMGILREDDEDFSILVKGREALEGIVSNRKPRTLRQGAILVSCVEEAIAMRQVLGDGEDEADALLFETAN
jgi:hypothetical protein